MRKAKMLHVLTVALLFVASLAFGAGQGEATTADGSEAVLTAPGELPIVESPVTISAYAVQVASVQGLEAEVNLATAELQRRTNVILDLEVVLEAAADEKQSLLLASGDYPEVFLSGSFTNEDILLYGVQQGIFMPLNDLIEDQGVEVKHMFAYYPELRANITAPDGNIYGLPGINECYHCTYSQKMWINREWLDNLGLETPTTTGEFYDVLKAVRDGDPNGNGDRNDEIPLMGSINSWHNEMQHFLMSSFVYDNNSDFFVVNDREISFAPAQPEWRDGLRYLRNLYDEGLIYPASFTQTREQAQQIGDNPGEALFFAGTAGHVGMYMRIENDPPYDRHAQYEALAPLRGPGGVQYSAIYRDFGGAKFVITDKAQHPEVAFRLADYMWSEEGTHLMEAGPEGVAWEPAGPNDKGLLGNPARYRDIRMSMGHGDIYNHSWMQTAPTVRTAEYRASWAASQDLMTVDGYELRLFRETHDKYEPYAPDEWYTRVFFDPEDVEEVAQMQTNILDYVRQSMVQFIVGDLDIDRDWDRYLSQLERLEVERYLDLHQTAYDAKF